ncbi:hypothetical protein BDV37DRAFT_263590 [Aspergillus pseudonomiae]|uniref:Uncharacterized protein n=1 Tax=Aspergillus pseudonomiae TaxID=1506151 RepID=A0A5N7CVZ5_9EURO|nr:uncharacterized protein BDV37DRAFT_263590 [Aspergillus pseudonomiae]KAE8398350.1 hypothetical protein BDV37DRAFT_263590 [Aspergillus pseudonomiae]
MHRLYFTLYSFIFLFDYVAMNDFARNTQRLKQNARASIDEFTALMATRLIPTRILHGDA